MRFRHIEIFHAVYTCGSISKAAEFLNVSQPSVSKVLQHAELNLGFKLFHRIKGRLAPTNRAAQLFQEVDLLYKQLQSVRRSARNLRNDDVGKIRLALTPAFAFCHIPKLTAEFQRQYPDATFDIQTRHFRGLVDAIIEHYADLAIGFGQPDDPRIVGQKLGDVKIVALRNAPAQRTNSSNIPIRTLEQDAIVSITESGPLGQQIKNYLQRQNIVLNNRISVQTYYLAAKIVEQGLGTALLDEFSAASLAPNTDIRSYELKPALSCPLYCFYHADKPLQGICNAYLEFISDWAKQQLG